MGGARWRTVDQLRDAALGAASHLLDTSVGHG
jgi:hypothetical protein